MNFNIKTLQKAAAIAKLHIAPDQERELCQDLNKLLVWMQTLNEVDTTDTTPLITPSAAQNRFQNNAQDTLSHQQALYNAPSKDTNYFRVPHVFTSQANTATDRSRCSSYPDLKKRKPLPEKP